MSDKQKKLYLQIHHLKLGHYVSCGLICPDKYLIGDIEKDIQSINCELLTLSTTKAIKYSNQPKHIQPPNNELLTLPTTKTTKHTDAPIEKKQQDQMYLELTLTPDECNKYIQNDNNIFFIDKPLPITRIKAIYCENCTKNKKDIVKKLKQRNFGFMPERLFKTIKKNDLKKMSTLDNNIKKPENREYENIEFCKTYDKIMGMFAFAKNAHLYYTNKNKIYKNYPTMYFKIFDNTTNEIKVTQWLGDLKNDSKFSEIFKLLIDKLKSTEIIDSDFIKNVISKTDNGTIKNHLSELLEGESNKKTLKELEQYDAYYYICLLYLYRRKESNDKNVLKNNIIDEVPYDKIENALALFGLYYGYSKLKTYEEIKLDNDHFKKINGNNDEYSIKFKLDSKFDYYLIEAIYQYSLKKNNGAENSELDFIDYLFPPKKINKNLNVEEPNIVDKKTYHDIVDLKITQKEWGNYLSDKIKESKKYKDELIDGKDYIVTYTKRHYPNLIKYRAKTNCLYCNKNELQTKIQEENYNKKPCELIYILKADNII
ncbi:MAG: hypothetical protein DRQ51_03215 [Gammaproteobacteria bacterium]|nr:MAG: hypothetical protein DRQ51_03215 [Gammaproteobacteria bacterium]